MGEEVSFSDGPDPHVTGKPDNVRVRLTRVPTGTILVTLEATWAWDPGTTERPPPPDPQPPSREATGSVATEYPCPDCERKFSTSQGRAMHHRRTHKDGL